MNDMFRDERRQLQSGLDGMRTDIDEHKKEQNQLRARINEIDQTKRELVCSLTTLSASAPESLPCCSFVDDIVCPCCVDLSCVMLLRFSVPYDCVWLPTITSFFTEAAQSER